jgi:hypothetical protein
MSNPQQGNGKARLIAYTVVEWGEGKSYWLRVGNAFENRDGSLNVYLDAIPVNGRLQIRQYAPDDERDAPQGASGGGTGQHERSATERSGSRRAPNTRGA